VGDGGSDGQAGRAGSSDWCRVGQVGGERGDAEVRARGGTPDSVSRLDRWILVMDL
jgi:hypothetical protein